jgi:hypothetical protein
MDDKPMRLGSLESPHGAVYMWENREQKIRVDAEIQETTFKLNMGFLTPEIQDIILALCRSKQNKLDRLIDRIGIPNKFKELFKIDQKAKVQQYCRELTVHEIELDFVIHNCSQLGFTYHYKFPIYVPEHLKTNDSDFENPQNGKPPKFIKKYNARLVAGQEKRIHVHLFENGSQWHFFYGTYQDMQSDNNHWENGSHIHYLNHLWSNYSKEQVWESFDKRNVEISGSVHIRFEKIQYPPPNIPW